MTLHRAEKVVFIVEKIILKGVCKIIEDCGASGYTVYPAGGKGSRNVRTTTDVASVIDEFSNVKIDVIVNSMEMAEDIMNKVAEEFFDDYSGITYLEGVNTPQTMEIYRGLKWDWRVKGPTASMDGLRDQFTKKAVRETASHRYRGCK